MNPENRLHHLWFVRDVMSAWKADSEIDPVLDEVCAAGTKYLGVHRTSVMLYSEQSGGLIYYRGSDEAPQRLDPATDIQPPRSSISGACFSRNEPVVDNDCLNSGVVPKFFVEQLGLRSSLAVPLAGRTGPLGVLRVDDTNRPDRFTADDVAMFTAIGNIVGIIMENTRFYIGALKSTDDLVRANRELKTALEAGTVRVHKADMQRTILAQLAMELVSVREAPGIAQALKRATQALFGWDAFIFSERVPHTEQFIRVLACDTIDGVVQEVDNTLNPPKPYHTREELQSGQPLLIHREQDTDSGLSPFGDHKRRSATLLYAPIAYEEMLNGILSIQSYEVRKWDELDKALLLSVANLVAPALRRLQAERALQWAALHDSLTKLPNRVLFMERLNHSLAAQARHMDRMLALMVLDLDKFKEVNDTHGHLAGDEFLRETARRLLGVVRDMDTVCRLGGDEFVILLEELPSAETAFQIADRVIRALSRPVVWCGVDIPSAASGGLVVGEKPGTHATGEDMFRRADKALYRAKRLGRGRYEVYETSDSDSPPRNPQPKRMAEG